MKKQSELLPKFESLNVNKNTLTYKAIKDVLNVPFTNFSQMIRVVTVQEETDVQRYSIRPCFTTGSGKTISNEDHTDRIKGTLDLLGVVYDYTNDAPRKGKTGQLLIIKDLEVCK